MHHRRPSLTGLLLLAFLLLGTTVEAQISFFRGERLIGRQLPVEVFVDSSSQHGIDRYQAIRERFTPLSPGLNMTYQDRMLWMRLPLRQLPEATKYLLLRNPHINYLRGWLLRGDSVYHDFGLTGDRLPFYSRPVAHSDFVFRLPADDSLVLLLLIDKRNEVITLPIHAFTEEDFLSYTNGKNLITGLLIGLSLFVFLFNLFLFVQMRERLYVYYGLYIAFMLFYLLSDTGFSQMYLFPRQPAVVNLARPLAITLCIPVYFLFCLSVLQTRHRMPRVHPWLIRFLFLYLFLFLVSLPFLSNTGPIRVGLHNLMLVLLLMFYAAILLMSGLGIYRRLPYAAYVLVATLILLAFGLIYSGYLSGLTGEGFLYRNAVTLGFAIEISLLSFALSLRFKNYKDRSEQLAREIVDQQDRIFRTVTDYQEKELQRLSSLLHDSVGAQLAALRYKLESGQASSTALQEAVADISELTTDVRNFSHSLSPALLQKKGAVEAIQQQIERINSAGKLYIQFESIGSVQKTTYRYELVIYTIVLELVHNIIKHAAAGEAIVQLMLEPELVSIFVEDDGQGCDPQNLKEGLGFMQIKQLATFVKGQVRIETGVQKGCRVSIEFPLLPDERQDSYSYR